MSASLEDRARELAQTWGYSNDAVYNDILKELREATERATEDARAELNLATSRLNMQLIQAERAAEAARGEVERAKHEAEENKLEWYAAVRDMRRAHDEADKLRAELAEARDRQVVRERLALTEVEQLRERLAGAERLIEEAASVQEKGADAVLFWLRPDVRAFRAGAPAAPVTPVEPGWADNLPCPVTETSCSTCIGVCKKVEPAPVTPAEPTEVLTVSCPHGPEACDGCLSATVEGRPLPAVTPKREPRACTEPAHRHFDLEDACACPDVASEPQSEAPTARVKCDHGDACPGHAPGDRPCNWEPSPEAAPPAPGPERCRQCDGVLILSCPEGCELPEVCESGCAESVTHHDVEGVPLCTACFESLPDEQAPEDAPPAPCDECDQNDPLNDHGSHGSPEDAPPAPCPCNPEKPVWEQAHHFYCVRLNRAAPPAPAADVPRGPTNSQRNEKPNNNQGESDERESEVQGVRGGQDRVRHEDHAAPGDERQRREPSVLRGVASRSDGDVNGEPRGGEAVRGGDGDVRRLHGGDSRDDVERDFEAARERAKALAAEARTMVLRSASAAPTEETRGLPGVATAEAVARMAASLVVDGPMSNSTGRLAAPPGGSSPPECGRTYPSKHSGITMTCLREPGHAPVEGACLGPDGPRETVTGGGSSPGSEEPFEELRSGRGREASLAVARWLAWKATGKAFDDMSDWGQDRYLEEARALLLADRDAVVSRARLEGRAEAFKEAEGEIRAAAAHWRNPPDARPDDAHMLDYAAELVAALVRATTEAQTGGGE